MNKFDIMAKKLSDEPLKVLRVAASLHQKAKIKAAERGEKMQSYIEKLIEADIAGKINWDDK